jgi:hypothetical protein
MMYGKLYSIRYDAINEAGRMKCILFKLWKNRGKNKMGKSNKK